MSGAGRLRDRVKFQREENTPDGGGGSDLAWTDITKVRGRFTPERGREKLEAGRLEDAMLGTLIVRSSTTSRTITSEDRALINGEPYQIRSITNPDRRNRDLEMTVERGVGT